MQTNKKTFEGLNLHPESLNVMTTVNRIVNTADNKNWDEGVECFTEVVQVDHDSHKGHEPLAIPRNKLIEDWIAAFKNMSHTWHQISNHQVVVDGNKAVCISKVFGLHVGADRADVYAIGATTGMN